MKATFVGCFALPPAGLLPFVPAGGSWQTAPPPGCIVVRRAGGRFDLRPDGARPGEMGQGLTRRGRTRQRKKELSRDNATWRDLAGRGGARPGKTRQRKVYFFQEVFMTENGKRRSIPERSMVTSLLLECVVANRETGTVDDHTLAKAAGIGDAEVVPKMQSVCRILLREYGETWKRIPKTGYERAKPMDAVAIGVSAVSRMHNTARVADKRMGGCGDVKTLPNESRVKLNAAHSMIGAIGQFTQVKTTKRLEAACQQKADKLLVGETLRQFGVE